MLFKVNYVPLFQAVFRVLSTSSWDRAVVQFHRRIRKHGHSTLHGRTRANPGQTRWINECTRLVCSLPLKPLKQFFLPLRQLPATRLELIANERNTVIVIYCSLLFHFVPFYFSLFHFISSYLIFFHFISLSWVFNSMFWTFKSF